MLGWLPCRLRNRNNAIKFTALLVAAGLAAAVSPSSRAEELTIAVASNFAAPMNEITQAFEAETDHEVRLAFGSSGKLYAQIRHGAPFDAFFSADQDKISRLMEHNLVVASSRMTYAEGRLVLWSANDRLVDSEGEILASGRFSRLAIANPKLAPYGAAALEVLAGLGLEESTKSKRVMGENISQTYQYVASGNAQLGLIALSQVYRDGRLISGSGWIVPEKLYRPIRQDAAILSRSSIGRKRRAIDTFWHFFQGPKADAIIQSYGYRLAGASNSDQGMANAD